MSVHAVEIREGTDSTVEITTPGEHGVVVIREFIEPVNVTTTLSTVVEVEVPGPRGQQGPTGEQGPPGPSGGSYHHQQLVQPSRYWLVQHNLGFRPGGVAVTDAEGHDVEPVVTHLSENVLMLTFFEPTAGTAAIS